jgi:hypothetical protein
MWMPSGPSQWNRLVGAGAAGSPTFPAAIALSGWTDRPPVDEECAGGRLDCQRRFGEVWAVRSLSAPGHPRPLGSPD